MPKREDNSDRFRLKRKRADTAVNTMANAKPPVDNVETVKYIIEEGKKTGINVLPVACVSVEMKGQNSRIWMPLKAAGAVGFTDDESR